MESEDVIVMYYSSLDDRVEAEGLESILEGIDISEEASYYSGSLDRIRRNCVGDMYFVGGIVRLKSRRR